MTDKESNPGEDRSTGFLHPVKSLVATFASALHSRLELFVTELEEERQLLKQALVLALLVFFGLSVGFILFTVFIVALFWQQGWVYAIGALAAIYLAAGIVAALRLRRKFRARTGLFSATLAELSKDRDRWQSLAGE